MERTKMTVSIRSLAKQRLTCRCADQCPAPLWGKTPLCYRLFPLRWYLWKALKAVEASLHAWWRRSTKGWRRNSSSTSTRQIYSRGTKGHNKRTSLNDIAYGFIIVMALFRSLSPGKDRCHAHVDFCTQCALTCFHLSKCQSLISEH